MTPTSHPAFVARCFADKAGAPRQRRHTSDAISNLPLGPDFTGGKEVLKALGEQANAERTGLSSQENVAETVPLHLESHER